MSQKVMPEWLQILKERDPKFTETYMAQSKEVLKDGAIPAKYKILMTMIVDAVSAHAAGCAAIAKRARANGATEEEIMEAVQVAYLFGGTPALVTAANALQKE